MPKFRTKKSNRTTYIYKDANGRKVTELRPGENGVTEAFITALHEWDDAVHNADKHPVLDWNIGNVVAETDAHLNVKMSKKKSTEKIDGAGFLSKSSNFREVFYGKESNPNRPDRGGDTVP